MYSRGPGYMFEVMFFEFEKDRDEVVVQIKEIGLIKTDFHKEPGGQYVMVYEFSVINAQEFYRLERKEGE